MMYIRAMVDDTVEIEVSRLQELLGQPQSPVLIDVRETFERQIAYIAPSRHIPQAELEQRIRETVPELSQPIVLYCAKGERSRQAQKSLASMGYARARSLAGGMESWQIAGLPAATDEAPKGRQWAARYARQTRMPQVGVAGQKKLLDAKVLLIGAGGLGSPAAYYLAAAGVGTLGLVDYDRVDETNLHRQILYKTSDVGTPKVYSAQATLQALNPDVHVVPYHQRFTKDNAEEIVRDYDVVIDGADNFQTRYLANDVCLLMNKPNVHGAIHQFEGQVSVFCLDDGPCYRCLFPEPPPAGWVPSCAEAGVLGLLPGVVGTLQATEAVKFILGIGDLLRGRLLRFDALRMTFESYDLSRRDDCDYCRPGSPFPGFVDYDEFCGSA
jgi:molybdopterin/thiamine biosynthesis adenylyltransferase/rhodanese-related sulfurtransferase